MASKRPSEVLEGKERISDGAAIKMSRLGGADINSMSKHDRRDVADVSTREDNDDPDDKVVNKAYKSSHTMESDDEEEEKYQRLNMDKVEGQEEATMDYDDNIKLTAFNMKEEEDDGHFDAMGNFVFNKKKEDIQDAWLDNVDWSRVKGQAGKQWDGKAGTSEEAKTLGDEEEKVEEEEPEVEVDVVAVYTQLMAFLKPNETITKALKRLGGNVSAADARKARWAAKKAAKTTDAAPETPSEVAKLTELVDQLVATGEFEAYGYTKEKLKFEIEKRENLRSFAVSTMSGYCMSLNVKADATKTGAKDVGEDDLDMFGESVDAAALNTKTVDDSAAPEKSSSSSNTLVGNVQWEFKSENTADAKVMGPCSSQQMLDYQESGKFKEGVWVRKVGEANTQFYSSRRIDFDLYV